MLVLIELGGKHVESSYSWLPCPSSPVQNVLEIVLQEAVLSHFS